MARNYRFFLRNLAKEILPVRAELPLRITEKLEPEIFYQLVKVLRVAPGDSVVLMPRTGGEEFDCAVESAQKKEIVLRFKSRRKNGNELSFRLELILCLPNKPDKLGLILQKAVELGAAAVTLAEGDFSRMKHNLRAERLEKIMTEAAEQSERAYVPELNITGKLRDHLARLDTDEKTGLLVAMERGNETPSLQSGLKEVAEGNPVKILIGPEGGFSPEEKALMENLGLRCFTLGKRILRMETAAIVSLGIAASCAER